jgi:hypothetical protein
VDEIPEGGHAMGFRKDMKFARCDEYYGFQKETADIRSYEIPEGAKLRKGAMYKSREGTDSTEFRNSVRNKVRRSRESHIKSFGISSAESSGFAH